jgi:hypothetical protein
MPGAVSTYDPQFVNAIFGPMPLLGLADGTMFEVAMQGDGVRAQVGTQGEAVLVENHNFSAEVTCRFMATGLGAVTLSRLHAHKRLFNIALPFILRSIDTGETVASGLAKIKNFPDVSFGDEAPVREVVFVLARLELSAIQ